MMTALWPELGERMFGVVWGFVAIGIGMKLVCGDRYKLLFLALYLGMGWLGLAILRPLLAILPNVAAHWGGLIYSVGAIVHARARMPFHNAVWHAMILVAVGLYCRGATVRGLEEDKDSMGRRPQLPGEERRSAFSTTTP
jgi:hemolysin III